MDTQQLPLNTRHPVGISHLCIIAAMESSENVWILPLIVVSKRLPVHGRCSSGRGTTQYIVLAIEEVCAVLAVFAHCLEALEWHEGSGGQLPAAVGQQVHPARNETAVSN